MSDIVKANIGTHPEKFITGGISYVSYERASGA